MSGARLEDRRRHNFFILDNEVIDDYIELIPEHRRADALAVYSVLARHANEHGVAWPGVAYIGRKIGRSRPTVIDAVKELGKLGLVGKEERADTPGGQATNIYTLPPVEKGRSEASGVNTVNRGCKQDLQGGVNEIDTKKTQREEDPEKNSRKGADALADVMVNPGKYFSNLLKTAGKEPTDRERERCFVHMKQLIDKHEATRVEMEKIASSGFQAHMNGYEWWPKDLLRKLRQGNVTHLRAVEPTRPAKKVIS
jgi:predicted transcriptional regulator